MVPTVDQPGSCAAGVSGALQSPAWADAVDMCMVTNLGGGCPSGWGCAARPHSTLDASPCIEQSGVADCPASYPDRQVYYGDFQDARSCSTTGCSCTAAAGETCEGLVSLYDNDVCSNQPVAQYPLDGTCHAAGFNPGEVKSGQLSSSVSGGSCSASGTPSVVGDVTETSPRTVCCVSP